MVRSVVKPTNINKAGEIPFTVNVNDNKTNTNATVQINVVNDGNSAQAIANTINNKGYGLKVNTAGQYADSSYIMKNWTNLLTANYGVSADDADHITLPHVKLANDNPKTTATVKKDGQIFTANVDLECKTGPYIYYYIVNNNYVQLYVNLNAQLLSYLKTYFVGETYHDDLKYFYNMLDDNQDHQHLPDYKGKYLIPWGNRLDQNMDTYGNTGDTTGLVIKYEADTSVSSIGEFANQFHSAVMNSNNYLTVMFE